MSMTLCLRCGRHEQAGSYCTWCRTAEYDLADHEHVKGEGCPLGPYLDPLSPNKTDIRRYLAKPRAVWAQRVVIRHHPRTAGYTTQSDPPVPSWVRDSLDLNRVRAARRPDAVIAPVPAIRAPKSLVREEVRTPPSDLLGVERLSGSRQRSHSQNDRVVQAAPPQPVTN